MSTGALCRILHGTLVGFFFASSRMNHRQHLGVIRSAVVAYAGFFVMWSTSYKIILPIRIKSLSVGRYYSRLLAESKARFLSDKTLENAWEFYDRYQSLFAIREAGEKTYLDMCGTYQADGNADGTFEMSGTLDEIKTSAALSGLVLSRNELTLKTGQTAALGVSASPAGTMLPHVWWEGSDEVVASVSDGAVTALAKGTAVITVHSEDLTAQCVVNVTGQEHFQSKSDDSDDDDTAAARTGGMQLMNPAYLGEGSWSFDPVSGSWSCKKPDGSLLKSC